MEKTRSVLDILLPEIPNERDECVSKIIQSLEYKRGIEKVHIVEKEGAKAQLCFHYDPEVIATSDVERAAKDAGAEITERYGHLLIEVSGIRHARHARLVETSTKRLKGMQSVSVSANGFIQLEYTKADISKDDIISSIGKEGLSVKQVDDFHSEHEGHSHDHGEHNHEKHEHSHEGHDHSHGGVFAEKTELVFAALSGALLGIGFGLSFISSLS